MTNISSNYANLFGSKVKPAAPQPAPLAPIAAPEPTRDALTLSVQAQAAPAASGVASSAELEQVRQEMAMLRTELASLHQEIEGLMKQLGAQGTQSAAPAVPTTPAASSTAPATNYTVQGGDYLWKIARDQLGDANRWKEIYELNKDTIGDNPNLLKPGQVLKLPARSTPAAPAQVQQPTPATPPPAPATPQPAPQVPVAVPPVATPPVAPATPPTAPVTPPAVPATPPAVTPRNLSDQDVARLAQSFGLAPDRANVLAFLDEMDSYQGSQKGKVFGPGMESLAATPEESLRFRQSVQQIQQALNLLIKGGKLKPMLPNGQAVSQLSESGSFFKLDAQGKEIRDAQGTPQMDEAFIATITQFKQERQVHQNYRLADGSYGINEYVGPTTIEQIKQALMSLQA